MAPAPDVHDLASLLADCYGVIVFTDAFSARLCERAEPWPLAPTAAALAELEGVRIVVVGSVFTASTLDLDANAPTCVRHLAGQDRSLVQPGHTQPVVVRTPLVMGADTLVPPILARDLDALGTFRPADTWVSVITAHQGAQAIVGALEFGVPGHTYTLGGTKYTWRSLAESVARYAGHTDLPVGAGSPSCFAVPFDSAARQWIAARNWAYPASEVQQALRYRAEDTESAIRAATVDAAQLSRLARTKLLLSSGR